MKIINLNSRRTIELKDGNNTGLIIGFCFVIFLICVFSTSKLWLPDDRVNFNYTKNTEYNFSMISLKLPSNVKYDEEKSIIEFSVKENQFTNKEKFDLIYKAYADDGSKLPFQVIQGVRTDTNKLTVTKQEKLLQVRVPTDFYYVKITVEQKDGLQEEFCIDYRNVKHEKIKEKGKDYLLNQNAEIELSNQNNS